MARSIEYLVRVLVGLIFSGGLWAQGELVPLTPIKHLVIIYDENVSFDHYFGTYPKALNLKGEPVFQAKPHTPSVRGLLLAPPSVHPIRLGPGQAMTSDQQHQMRALERSTDGGLMDHFPSKEGQTPPWAYFDGNTVSKLWQWAQEFTLNDNTYTDVYGPSTEGALALIAGQTNGVEWAVPPADELKGTVIDDSALGNTLVGDVDPFWDECSRSPGQVRLKGPNIGMALSQANVSWGAFMGGFDRGRVNANQSTGCHRSTVGLFGQKVQDYIPHHAWFQYYEATANPHHLRPLSVQSIGWDVDPKTSEKDPANHQYDLEDLFVALQAGNLPAVSFVKLIGVQDGHAGYSDPLDEQQGLERVVESIQKSPEWANTAIIITYDDSDGWYDHRFTPVQHPSYHADLDLLSTSGACGVGVRPLGLMGKPVDGRCGPGPRIPLLILSPWVRSNWVDHHLLVQSSLLRFIEDNWLHGKRLGQGSFDEDAGDLMALFQFKEK